MRLSLSLTNLDPHRLSHLNQRFQVIARSLASLGKTTQLFVRPSTGRKPTQTYSAPAAASSATLSLGEDKLDPHKSSRHCPPWRVLFYPAEETTTTDTDSY